MLNNLWVEKYRPTTLNDIVLSENYKKVFQKFIDEKEISNLLFLGPAGSGKTTTARILIDHIIDEESDVLFVNGNEDNNVEFVRTNITSFLMSSPFGTSKVKIVFIDEFDFTSQSAQAALRTIIERFSETGRFILTANYSHKILDPIISRCQTFKFESLSNKDIKNYILNILDKENININVDNSDIINNIINRFKPDVRKIVNTIQSNIVNNELVIESFNTNIVEDKIKNNILQLGSLVKKKDMSGITKVFKEIEEIIKDKEIDYYKLYNDLFFSDLPFNLKIIIGDSFDRFPNAVIPQLHFMTCMYKIVESLLRLYNLK